MAYWDHVHRIFDALDPHTAANVRPTIDADQYAQRLTVDQRNELEADVRSLDPSNLNYGKAVTA